MISTLALSLLLQPSDAPNVVRVYDLEAVASAETDQQTEPLRLLPYFDPSWASDSSWISEDEYVSETEEELMLDPIVSILRSMYPEEFEFEGRMLDVIDGGRLLVRGPEDLQARIERVLAFLHETFGAQVELEVTTVRSDAPYPGPPVAPDAEVEAWLHQFEPPRARKRHYLRVRADRPAVLDLAQERTFITEYETEIADTAFMVDPVVVTCSFGMRIVARATPVGEGLALALVLASGDLAELETRRNGVRAAVFGQDATVRSEGVTGTFQSFEVLSRSMALSTYLPAEHALVLSTELDRADGRRYESVVVRRTGGALPQLARLPFDDGGAELIVANVAASYPPRAVAEGRLLVPNRVRRDLIMPWDASHMIPLLSAFVESGGTEWTFQLFADSLDWFEVYDEAPWLIALPQGGTLQRAEEKLGEQRRILDRLQAGSPPPRLLDISVEVVRIGDGAKDGKVLSTARVPARAGQSATMVVGVEGLELVDYDVEIAQKAASPNPRVQSVFDGLALWLLPRLAPNGDLSLEVRGGAHVRSRPTQRIELAGNGLDWLDQSAFDHAFFNERLTLQRSEEGWSTTLGEVDGAGGLELRIAIRE